MKRSKKALNCITKVWQTQLLTIIADLYGCKRDWRNIYECDDTPDNSAWTSIVTDKILKTSPNVYNGLEDISYLDSQDKDETLINSSGKHDEPS